MPETLLETDNMTRTSIGYVDIEHNQILSSSIKDDGKGNPLREMILVPAFSILLFENKIDKAEVMDSPCIDEIMSFAYSLSLGVKITKPQFQNSYLDKPVQTFFSDRFTPVLNLTTRTAFFVESYYNYIVMNKWNNKRGILEDVYREYRSIQSTLALDIVRSIQAYQNGASNAFDRDDKQKIGLAEIKFTKRMRDNIASELSTPEEALAFLDGIAILACWRSHDRDDNSFKSSNRAGKLFYEEYDEEQIADISYADPVTFFGKKNIRLIKNIGNFHYNIFYVVPQGKEEIIEIFSDEEHNGEMTYFIYDSEFVKPVKTNLDEQLITAKSSRDEMYTTYLVEEDTTDDSEDWAEDNESDDDADGEE